MTYDLVIKNCRIVKTSGSFWGEIAIAGGKIVAIGEKVNGPSNDRIDAGGKFALPGVIDTHVHLGTAEQTFAEAVFTETAAAVAGGVTTAIIYRHIPVVNETMAPLTAVLGPDIKAIEENSLIDIGFHGLILDEEAIDRIDELVESFGITSFKFIMAYKGEEAMPHFYGMRDGCLFKAMERVGKEGCLAVVHAENSEINERFKEENRNRRDLAAWSDSRPNLSEEESIRKALFLAERAESPLCIAHVSTEAGARYIGVKKRQNKYLFQETCPHYLSLNKYMRFNPPSLGKVNPPLREDSDVSALWTLLEEGTIDVIGSDHCPFTLKTKSEDLWRARPGIPGIGILLPVLLSHGVNKRRITIEDVCRVTSFQPSKLFGLYPQKGVIAEGSDADLVIVDLENEVRVTHSILRGISDFSPYESFMMRGWPAITIANGRVVFQDGRLVNAPRNGKYLKRRKVDFSSLYE